MLDWDRFKAGIYRAKREKIRGIKEVDDIKLSDLVGLQRQKEALIKNTENFISSKPFNHALLWGSRGTGKSALIKAILNEYYKQNLRVVQVFKDDLKDLPYILDELREEKYKFIVFCDDLSFEKGDDSYKGLKPVLDGSIEKSPNNIVLYATSNRRHLLREVHEDNESVEIKDMEIHYSDQIEEKISLSDRFGLWISFYQGNFEDFLNIVDSYFVDFQGDRTLLHKKALEFANLRASRSGRTAKQFYNYYKGSL